MGERSRPIQMKFYVTEQERDVIHQRMALIGTTNLGDFMRKISQDGFLYRVNIEGVPEICRQIEAIGQNINQIAKRVNSTNTAYAEDIRQIRKDQEEIWQLLKYIESTLR